VEQRSDKFCGFFVHISLKKKTGLATPAKAASQLEERKETLPFCVIRHGYVNWP
jgi:hypothetical protein